MSLKDLKNKWYAEKESYITKEVGSGVQKFIKDAFKSEDIFNLKEGLVSTLLINRKNEFTEESSTKASRRADILIYINPDIIIPVEVEKYGNIKAGLEQLFQYQLDLDKKYGILTDGYTWQFYNNTYLLKEFNLEEIFNRPKLFVEFWKEYIKPEFYYLSFFEGKGQLQILPDYLLVEKRRQDFFRDITTLIRSFENKLQLEGYLKELGEKEAEKRTVELTYAYIIQFILYKTLVDNDFGKFDSEFKEKTKAIHEYLKIKQYGKILGIIEGISNEISQNIYRPFKKEQEFINQTVFNLIRQPKNELNDVSPWLDIFVFIKKYNFSNIQNEIFGYIYENYLKEIYEEEKKGQYFTDPAIVNFMLKQIGYDKENIQARVDNKPEDKHISIIDPSCGSGTFLYSAVNELIKAIPNGSEKTSKKIEELVNELIFGLDIAEFPLYLAEMNVLMRLLPLIINEKYNNPIDKKIKVFWTKDSIAEFIFSRLNNTDNDLMGISGGQQILFDSKELNFEFESYMREHSDLKDMKLSMQPPRKRFDYVIGNPPYIGYNECAKQELLIFKYMKANKVKLSNIYGVNLHSIPNNQKKNPPKPNLYAFFISLGIALLKDDGKLSYIIPQTLLTAGDLDVIRYHLAKITTIEKIITFSGKMFVGRGLKQDKPVATSSLIFVINKKIPSASHQVEVINYKNSNDDIETSLKNILAGKEIDKKTILQSELLQNVANWNFIKQGNAFLDFYKEYKKSSESLSIYYEHLLAERQFESKFYFDIGYDINERLLNSKSFPNGYQYPKINENYFTIKTIRGYWPNERDKRSKFQIKLLTTNQAYNLLDSPYKILWSYINPRNFHFSSLPLIWARNQICSIGSRNKQELLYLLSILNTQINLKLLNSLLRSENEKDLLISMASVKEFIRVPKITKDNQSIKDEVIKLTENLLNLEDRNLSDFVDFSKIMIQKFDNISVEDSSLILHNDNKEMKLNIRKNTDLVKKIIQEKYDNKKLFLDENKINISELKEQPIIDFGRQKEIKNYIDDLLFALYFNISLRSIGINNADDIRKICSKNPHYKFINETRL
jgi:hypothetical protein